MSDMNTTPAKTPANWLREEAQQLEDLSSALDSSFEHSDDKAFIKGLISSAEHIDRLERERDEAREQWRMSSVCRQKDADLTALRAVADEMEAALKDFEGMMSESIGIAGYHLNGDVFGWDEGDDPLRDKTCSALTRYADLKKETRT